jgi:hypothetical protein
MRAATVVLSVLSALTLATPSAAGSTVPVSTLPSLAVVAKSQKRVASVAGLVVQKTPPYPKATYVNVDAAASRGYCFVSRDYTLRLAKSVGSDDVKELWHLSESGGEVTLERTLLDIDRETREVLVAGRASARLREVARSPSGVVAWAFRDGADVVVVAKGADGGVESVHPTRDDEPSVVPFVSSECAFGAVRIDARAPDKGAAGQLVGSLPPKGEGKDKVIPRFAVDVSLSRVARDPEPTLAVRVRVRD